MKYPCNSLPRKCFNTACQSGGSLNCPRLGFNFPDKILRAVDLPIPLVPTSPSTCPGRGDGRRWSLNELAAYRWVTSESRLVGRLMMLMAPKGHFLGQIPHPKIITTRETSISTDTEISRDYGEKQTTELPRWKRFYLLAWLQYIISQYAQRDLTVRNTSRTDEYKIFCTPVDISTRVISDTIKERNTLGLHLSALTMAILHRS